VAGGLLTLALAVCFGFLLPLYHLPRWLSLDQVPVAARKGPFDFGGQVRLLGWQAEKTVLAPGEVTYVTIYWQALTDPAEDYWLLLRLQGEDGKDVWGKDGSPSAGRDSTDLWRGGQVIAARHRVVVPSEASPGSYRLLAGLHRFGRWEWLLIQDQDGRVLGDTIALVGLSVREENKR